MASTYHGCYFTTAITITAKKLIMSPVWIFTRNNLEVNWSLTVKMWSGSMSFVFGSFESTRWVILPSANDCRERAKSRSGMSVSFLIS